MKRTQFWSFYDEQLQPQTLRFKGQTSRYKRKKKLAKMFAACTWTQIAVTVGY